MQTIPGNTIPFEISEYVKNHFDGDFIPEVIEESDRKGGQFFRVYITQNNLLYNLKFNSQGTMIEESTDPIWEVFEFEDFVSAF
jgi:hypothetical protein